MHVEGGWGKGGLRALEPGLRLKRVANYIRLHASKGNDNTLSASSHTPRSHKHGVANRGRLIRWPNISTRGAKILHHVEYGLSVCSSCGTTQRASHQERVCAGLFQSGPRAGGPDAG